METQIWKGDVDAKSEAVKTGCTVTKGEIISITATGTATWGANDKTPTDADGDATFLVDPQGVGKKVNAAALLVRIGNQTFVAGKKLVNWPVPATGELVFLINDAPNEFGDNSGKFTVTVTKISADNQTGNTGGVHGSGGPTTSNTGGVHGSGGPTTSNTGGVHDGGGPATDNNGPAGSGDTDPRPIPGLPANTQLTVTLINNEQWVRTATLNIDGKVETLEVAGNKAISKAYKTTTGKVTISLVDSQQGAMRLPANLDVSPLGATGKSMTFGAEKPKDEKRPGFMDVFVHIDWNTDITN